MKKITEIIRKVLKEETKDNNDYLMFVTMTGGRLIIPRNADPKIKSVWDSAKYFANLNTLEEIRRWALTDRRAKEVCETYHKDENLDTCFARLVQFFNNISVDGGVISFDATLPNGERKNFKACFKTRDGGKVLDFDKRYLSGYYPEISEEGCFGNPWSISPKEGKKNSGGLPDSDNKSNDSSGGFDQGIKFKISLPMTKG
jgi:hypothetical protein